MILSESSEQIVELVAGLHSRLEQEEDGGGEASLWTPKSNSIGMNNRFSKCSEWSIEV